MFKRNKLRKIKYSYSLKIIAEASVVIDLAAKFVSYINTFEDDRLSPLDVIFKEETRILC